MFAIDRIHKKEDLKSYFKDELQNKKNSIQVQNIGSAFILSNFEIIKKIFPDFSQKIETLTPPQIRFRDAHRINGTGHLQPRKKKLTLQLFEECSDRLDDIISPIIREPGIVQKEKKFETQEVKLFIEERTIQTSQKVKENPYNTGQQQKVQKEIDFKLKEINTNQRESSILQVGGTTDLMSWIKVQEENEGKNGMKAFKKSLYDRGKEESI